MYTLTSHRLFFIGMKDQKQTTRDEKMEVKNNDKSYIVIYYYYIFVANDILFVRLSDEYVFIPFFFCFFFNVANILYFFFLLPFIWHLNWIFICEYNIIEKITIICALWWLHKINVYKQNRWKSFSFLRLLCFPLFLIGITNKYTYYMRKKKWKWKSFVSQCVYNIFVFCV